MRNLKIIMFIGVAAAYFIYAGIFREDIFKKDSVAVASVAAATLLWALIGCSMGFARARWNIALYFDREVHGDWVWSRALFLKGEDLERIAQAHSLVPLSHFGFLDEKQVRKMTWHEAEQGLATVSSLLKSMKNDSTTLHEPEKVIEDLTAIQSRLTNARDVGAGFCLVFHEDSINGMEIEQRKGRF